MSENENGAEQAVATDQPTQQPADPAAELQPVPGGKVFVDEAPPVVEPVNLEAPPPMRRYKAHKIVQAAKIEACGPRGDTFTLALEFPAINVEVPLSWAQRHEPHPGGYFVVYEDGYRSFSPAPAFEDGYRPLEEETVSRPATAADVPANDPPPPLRAARVFGAWPGTTAPRPREITTHQVNPANQQIGILVRDEPAPGGAPSRYELWGFDITKNPSQQDWMEPTEQLTLLFQNGPIADVGVNGITHEALLAVVADRMECWQNGPFACPENERALAHLRAALEFMRMREHRLTHGGS